MSVSDCPDVVLYRSLSERENLAPYDYFKESKEKKSYPKKSKSIYTNKDKTEKNYSRYLRLEYRRDRSFNRGALFFRPARKGRLGPRRDMSATSSRRRRESRKRELVATVPGIRKRATDHRR